jgi:hypothetical protein
MDPAGSSATSCQSAAPKKSTATADCPQLSQLSCDVLHLSCNYRRRLRSTVLSPYIVLHRQPVATDQCCNNTRELTVLFPVEPSISPLPCTVHTIAYYE